MEPGITARALFTSTVRVGGDWVAAIRPKLTMARVLLKSMIASTGVGAPVWQSRTKVPSLQTVRGV